MNGNSSIIPECYVDSCLIEVLLNAGKDHVNHQKGNGTVAKTMKEDFNEKFCIGIIDEDRKKLDYLKEFNLLKASHSLKLWKHKDKHQYLIQICPGIEKRIYDECTSLNIQLSSFNLPTELNALKKVSKSIASKRDMRFISLFKTMIEKKAEFLIELKTWIKYLKEMNYQADIKEL